MLANYSVNQDGVIYQVERTPFVYDHAYVDARYNTYGHLNEWMSHLRLGYVVGALGRIPHSLLDVGYGNGAFLATAKTVIPSCYGSDVSGYPVPDGVTFVKEWLHYPVEALTLFDVLEHFDDPYILEEARAENIIISLPWCHYFDDEWFNHWKHRRPNEHLWHFNYPSMCAFANTIGYRVISASSIEDTIRKHDHPYPNILTVHLARN